MKVLVVETMKKPYVKEINGTLKEMQTIVGGYIEGFPIFEDVYVFCNDEGKIQGLKPNRAVFDEDGNVVDIICGTFFLCSLNEGEDLSDELISKYTELFGVGHYIFKFSNDVCAFKYNEVKDFISYRELTNKHQKEVNEFPMFYAFSNKQFEGGMRKLNLQPDEEDKIVSVGMGFTRKTDAPRFYFMLAQHTFEHKAHIANDKVGDGYIKQMFTAELFNHEYAYTEELEDTLAACNITADEINNNAALRNGLSLAIKTVLKGSVY